MQNTSFAPDAVEFTVRDPMGGFVERAVSAFGDGDVLEAAASLGRCRQRTEDAGALHLIDDTVGRMRSSLTKEQRAEFDASFDAGLPPKTADRWRRGL